MKLGKSKLALAKVINENGGWLISGDFNFVTSSRYGAVKFFHQMPRRDGSNWVDGVRKLYWVDSDDQLPNWHKTILSREEYHQAYPKADADGWVEWNGVAKSPVGKGVAVDVKMKNGTQHFGQLIDDECWGDHWGDASIIAYRPHKLGVKPEFCESVMRSITDQEAKPTIEQLAQDYRNAKEYAARLQKDADEAKDKSEAIKELLIKSGAEIGIVISIGKAGDEIEFKIGDKWFLVSDLKSAGWTDEQLSDYPSR